MADKIQILIEAILKKTTEQELENELRKIEKNLKPLKVDVDTNAEAQVKLYKSLQKIYKEEEKQRLYQEKLSQKALADKEKILQYEQKVRMAIEEQKRKEEELNKKIQERIAIYKQEAEAKLSNLKVRYGNLTEKPSIQSQISEYQSKINNITPDNFNIKQLNADYKTLEANIKASKSAFAAANRDVQSLGDQFMLAWRKMMIWAGAGTLIFGSIRSFKDMVRIVSEVDKSLTEINKVLDLNNEQLKELAINASSVAKEYGKTTTEVLKATAAFAKTGLDKETAQNMAKLALLLSNVGDMTIESAQETLIAANAGYQLGNSYQSLLSIIDKFNEIANQNATEVSQLAEAWKVSAATAKQAGLSIDEYTALVGTAQSVTQRSGSEIGNAWRTILMRIQGVSDGVDTLEEDVSKAEQALNSIGIAVRKSPNEFRPAMEVLEEFATKYKELEASGRTVELSYVTEALAGKHRANILKSTLQNFDMVNKQISEAMNSAGSAIKENERYMDSITPKSKQLIAVWEQLSQTVINSDWVKGALDLLIAGTETIDNVISQIGLLNTALLIVISTLTILRSKAIFDWITSLGSLFLEATKSVGVFSAAMQVASASTVGLKTALLGLLTNPVALTIAAVGVIVGGIALWSNHQQKLREELEISKKVQEEYNATLNVTSKSYNELYESAVQSRKQIDANTASLMGSVGVAEKLIDRLEELATKENKSTFEKQQMKQIVDKLNESIPNLNLIIDETTGKLNQETSAVRNAVGAYKELLFVRAAEEKAKAAAARAYEAQLNIDKEKEKASKITYTKNGTPIFYSANENYNEVVRQNQKIIDEANKEIEQSFKMAEEYAKKYGNIEKNINNSVTKGTNFIPKSSDSSSNSSESKPTEIYEAEINQFQQLEDALAKVNYEIERNQALTDIAEDKDKINLLSKRIDLYKEEQKILHQLAEARRNVIQQNVGKLQGLGFDISYDRNANELVIRNMERLKQLKGKDAEATNKLRKETEELIKETLSLNDANRQAGVQYIRLNKDILSTTDSIKQIKEEQKKYAEDLIESYQEYLLYTIDKQIEKYEELKKSAQESAQKRIDDINEEIEKLEKENDELKEQEEREKRLSELAKQRELVENIQKEKNVRIFQNGEWIWVADPNKLKEETDKLKEMEEDYSRWEAENRRQNEIQRLKDQIKSIQDELKEEEKRYDEKIKKLQNFTKKHKEEIDKQKFQVTSYSELVQSLTGIEEESYKQRIDLLDKFVKDYNELMSSIKTEVPTGNVYSSKSSGSSGGGSSSSSSKGATSYTSTGNASVDSKLEQMVENSQNWHFANDEEKKELEEENKKLAEEIAESTGEKPIYDSDTGKWDVLKYDTGGVVDYTGLAMVHGSPNAVETVFNAEQGKKLYDFVKNLPNNMNFLNVRLPQLNIPLFKNNATSQTTENHYHFENLNIQANDPNEMFRKLNMLIEQYT
jgi:TP901 family phage tail tape measure protein